MWQSALCIAAEDEGPAHAVAEVGLPLCIACLLGSCQGQLQGRQAALQVAPGLCSLCLPLAHAHQVCCCTGQRLGIAARSSQGAPGLVVGAGCRQPPPVLLAPPQLPQAVQLCCSVAAAARQVQGAGIEHDGRAVRARGRVAGANGLQASQQLAGVATGPCSLALSQAGSNARQH